MHCLSQYIQYMLTLDWLADLHATYRKAFQAKVNEFDIGGREFHFDRRPCIMGVINLSKDSWYRESVCFNTDQALRRADLLLAQGADVIDLGAESTLAQASLVGVESQWESLEPIVEKIVGNGCRRVDLRWRLEPKVFAEMADLQFKLATNVLKQLRPGGRAVYSTCSIEPEENEHLIDCLLEKDPTLERRGVVRSTPQTDGYDGAFATLLVKQT